ncbi:hypothetical protein EDB85DRAFT_2188607 [Lactarius pseudohatsudake]|nr:hypothetical protein EDB85DRAFT_2188607 [Lactarius pseudohatsudake]
MPPFCANGAARTRGSGGRHAPVLCVRGGMHSRARAYGAAGVSWSKGEGPGAMGIGGRVSSCTPFCVNGEGWGRVACPRVPPSRAYGAAQPKGEGEGRGWHALVYSPRPRKWGRVGGREWRALAYGVARPKGEGKGRGMPSRASIPRVRGGKGRCQGQWGREAACPRAPPVRTNGEGWAGDRMPPCCTYGVAWPRGKGYRGRRARVHPFRANGEGRGGWPASRAPFRVYGAVRTRGKGQGRSRHGDVGRPAFARPLSARMGLRGQEGRGGADAEWWGKCPCATLPRERGGADEGEGRAREAEGRQALCAPYLRAKGVATVNAGKGWGDLPSCAPLCARCRGKGRRPALLRSLSVHTQSVQGKGGGSFYRGGSNTCLPRQRRGRHIFLLPQGPVCTLWRATPTFPPIPSSSLHATQFIQNWLCKDRRMSHPLSSTLLPSLLPSPSPTHSHRRGAYEGTPLPPSPSLPGPSLPMKGRTTTRRPRHLPSPGHAAPYAQEGGMRKHATRCHPSPLAAPRQYVREGGTRGHATPGPTLPHSRRRGVREGMPPPLPVAPDTSPSHPGVHEDTRPPIPIAPGPSPFDHDTPAALYARARYPGPPFPIHAEGGAPSACRPARAERGTPPPLPLVRAAPFARKGGMRGQAAPSRGAPFAWEWAHEAKTSSWTGAVSMRPRSPRPHPVCAT